MSLLTFLLHPWRYAGNIAAADWLMKSVSVLAPRGLGTQDPAGDQGVALNTVNGLNQIEKLCISVLRTCDLYTNNVVL